MDGTIDGKSLSSTARKVGSKEQNFVSLVSFFGQRSELILKMGITENKKESEIKVVERLLDLFEVKEGILTLYALHTQKNGIKNRKLHKWLHSTSKEKSDGFV
jgi:hypothetical protein